MLWCHNKSGRCPSPVLSLMTKPQDRLKILNQRFGRCLPVETKFHMAIVASSAGAPGPQARAERLDGISGDATMGRREIARPGGIVARFFFPSPALAREPRFFPAPPIHEALDRKTAKGDGQTRLLHPLDIQAASPLFGRPKSRRADRQGRGVGRPPRDRPFSFGRHRQPQKKGHSSAPSTCFQNSEGAFRQQRKFENSSRRERS